MHAAPPIPEPAASGRQCPKVIEQPAATPLRECLLWNRVGRFLQDVNASREIADEEIMQHAQDCTTLMERAYQRFEDFHNPADRDEAVLWMTRRDEARRLLSGQWKQAREAQIQQDIDRGGCFFLDEGEAARARLAGGRG